LDYSENFANLCNYEAVKMSKEKISKIIQKTNENAIEKFTESMA
jgi:hypothetical protein